MADCVRISQWRILKKKTPGNVEESFVQVSEVTEAGGGASFGQEESGESGRKD